MSASLIGGAVGAVVGFYFGGPSGAQLGFLAGSTIGGVVDTTNQRTEGPRLTDLKATASAYGTTIPFCLGAPRIAGQIWWASDRREIATSTEAGKGGGPTATEYTYEQDLLIGLHDGQADGLSRIWSNGKLIWTDLEDASDESRIASNGATYWRRITFYRGTEDQLPDPTYEAAVGYDQACAYRGRAYVFFEGLQLGNSGVMPNLTFEVCVSLSASNTITRRVGIAECGVDFGNTVPHPAIVDMIPEVRVALIDDTDTTVHRFDTHGTYLGTASRTALEDFPGPMGWVNPVTHVGTSVPAGILAGVPVRVGSVEGMVSPIGTPGLAIIRANCKLAGAFGISLGQTELTSVLPSGRYLGGFVPCSDGRHALVFTAPSSTYFGGALIDAWHMISFDGSHVDLHDSGTLEAPAATNEFGLGSVGGAYYMASSLEDDRRHVWTCYGAGTGDVSMYRIDPDNVLRLKVQRTFYVLDYAARYPTAWAQGGFCFCLSADSFHAFVRSGVSIDAVPVKDAVEALLLRAGMDGSQYDVSDLAGISTPLRAMVLSQVGDTRGALEQMRTAYGITVSLADKLVFTRRATAPVLTIPFADLGAGRDAAAEQPLAITQASDLELPAAFALKYLNTDDDQQDGTEYADRIISGQASTSTVQLALGMTPAEAKAVVDVIAQDAQAALVSTSLSLTLAYARLTPGDVVQVTDEDGNLQRLRLTKREDSGALLAFDAIGDDAAALVSDAVTDTGYDSSVDVSVLSETRLYLLDIPILRDADDASPGYYVAARGYSANWAGCTVHTSANGVDYSTVATVAESAVLGTCTTTLGDWAGGLVVDERNSVTVNVAHGQLASATRDAVLDDETLNAALIGGEIVQYLDAQLISSAPNIYTLRRLLRGRRGTEDASTGHAASENFTLLRSRGMRRVEQQATDVGASFQLKAVTRGLSLALTAAVTASNTGRSHQPLAPVDLRVARDELGGFSMWWKRRTRYTHSLVGGSIAAPLGEVSEAYEVDILDGFGIAKRTISATVPGCSYPRDDQIADFGAVQASVPVAVYQLGSYGRGQPLRATAATDYVPASQVNTITLGGAFAAGVPIEVVVDSAVLLTYTTTGGDTDTTGVAASLAAALDALPNYAAVSAGPVVTLTGPAGISYALTVTVGGGSSSIGTNVVQTAAYAGPGSSYIAELWVINFVSGVSEPVPAGITFRVDVQRPFGNLIGSISYTTPASSTKAAVVAGLAAALAAHPSLPAAGYSLAVTSSSTAGVYGRFVGPIGVADVLLAPSATAPYTLSVSLQQQGTPPVPADRPQIVDFRVLGAVATGETAGITLAGTEYTHVVSGGESTGDTMDALTATIDALADYGAVAITDIATHDTVRVTRAAVGVPFAFNTRILRPLTATVA